MSKAMDAADAIKRAAKQYEAFVAAAAILEQIGSLENAFSEGQKAVNAIRAEAEEAKAELVKLNAGAAKVRADQDAVRESALADASKIKADALADAAKIISDAKTDGVCINQIATDFAKSTTDQARAEVFGLAAQRDALQSEVSTLTDRADMASEAADEAEQRLANIKATIAKLAGI